MVGEGHPAKRRAGDVVLTRPYILRTEPTDSGESGYRPPSREWLKSKRVKRLNFEHLLDAEIKKTAFMARIES